MKGIIFTEFAAFVEDQFGVETVERMIQACDFEHGGAYTAVGTYDENELFKMLGWLHSHTKTAVSQLVKDFGRHLFDHYVTRFTRFFQDADNAVAFLKNVETHIHVEVKKLYPDAELPTFEFAHVPPNQLHIEYRSKRPLADLAEGLVGGCLAHFGESFDVQREDLPGAPGTAAHFVLTKVEAEEVEPVGQVGQVGPRRVRPWAWLRRALTPAGS